MLDCKKFRSMLLLRTNPRYDMSSRNNASCCVNTEYSGFASSFFASGLGASSFFSSLASPSGVPSSFFSSGLVEASSGFASSLFSSLAAFSAAFSFRAASFSFYFARSQHSGPCVACRWAATELPKPGCTCSAKAAASAPSAGFGTSGARRHGLDRFLWSPSFAWAVSDPVSSPLDSNLVFLDENLIGP